MDSVHQRPLSVHFLFTNHWPLMPSWSGQSVERLRNGPRNGKEIGYGMDCVHQGWEQVKRPYFKGGLKGYPRLADQSLIIDMHSVMPSVLPQSWPRSLAVMLPMHLFCDIALNMKHLLTLLCSPNHVTEKISSHSLIFCTSKLNQHSVLKIHGYAGCSGPTIEPSTMNARRKLQHR